MNKNFAPVFAAAALGVLLGTMPAQAMPERNDYFEDAVVQIFNVKACTKDGYSIEANIGINPSVMDLARKNRTLPRVKKVVLDEFMRLAGGQESLKNEVGALWQEIVEQLTSDDFRETEKPPIAPALEKDGTITLDIKELQTMLFYYSKNMLEVAPRVAPKYQQRIEDMSGGISVRFGYTGPADGKKWNPVKGCTPAAP